jgi:uncharacterized protein YlzI (FlbEa/FlbD family)
MQDFIKLTDEAGLELYLNKQFIESIVSHENKTFCSKITMSMNGQVYYVKEEAKDILKKLSISKWTYRE